MTISETVAALAASAEPVHITRDNVEQLLDSHQLEVAMRNGNWWAIRRNGATRRWAQAPERIRIPFKFGFKGFGAFTESDFDPQTGALSAKYYRVKPPEGTRK